MPARSIQRPESPRHAPSKLHARGQMPQALSYVHHRPYQNSGTVPTHSCHIWPQWGGKYCRSPGQGVIQRCPGAVRRALQPLKQYRAFRTMTAGGSLSKESGSAPLTGASAEVMAVDGAEEEDDGFEMVTWGWGTR